MKEFAFPFIIGFMALVGIDLQAQSISGIVIDAETQEPLVGANLYLKSNWRKGTSTDVNGRFDLDLTSIDTLILTYIGYEEKEIGVKPGSGPYTIKLSPGATNINEIVVKAERLIAEEFTYRKVQRLDIYTNPSAKADPLLAVNSLPSSTTLDESANISFRGSSPAETGIFLNNVPIYDAVRFSQLNGIGTFSIFNTAIVDNMRVFPGNPPLEYGNTTSGLIAIQTTEEIPEVATNSATLSLANFGIQTTRPIGEKTGFTAFSNYQPSAIIRGLNYNALEDIEKFRANDLGLHLTHNFANKSILKVFNYSLSESYDFNFVAPTFNGIFTQQKLRNFTVANWRRQISQSAFTINGGLSFSKGGFKYAETDISIFNRDIFLSANYQYQTDLFEVKTGFTYDYRQQHFEGTFYQFDYALGEGYPTTSENAGENLHRPEAYAYGKYYLGKQLIIGAGLRKNIPMDSQEHYLSKQVNARFEFNTNIAVIASAGEYYKYNLTQNESSTASLIQSRQLSVDFEYKNSPFEITSSFFHKSNEQSTSITTINGVELFIKGRLLRKLTGQLSYTLIDAESSTSNELTYPATYDLNYFIKGSLKYQFDGVWSVTSTFLYRDGQYHRPLVSADFDPELNVYEPSYASLSQQERLPEYSTIDLSISRLIPIQENLMIISFCSVSNVLNTNNVRSYSYNFDYSDKGEELFSKRTIYFGAVINF